jgi:hypothetical protein
MFSESFEDLSMIVSHVALHNRTSFHIGTTSCNFPFNNWELTRRE